MFFHVRDLELKPVHFDVELPPGTIEFQDPKLKQAAPLHAFGQAELVLGSLGEIRVKGQVQVRLQADCDRSGKPHAGRIIGQIGFKGSGTRKCRAD